VNSSKPEPCEIAEIIEERPLSGEFEEVLFGSDKGDTLWVKFSDKNGINEWVGKFGVRGCGTARVIRIDEPDLFIVALRSHAYLVNATHRKLIHEYQNDNALDITYDAKRKTLIVADHTDLHWVQFGGRTLFSRKISVDGIRELMIEGNILSGLGYANYDGEEKRFTFDLDQLKIIGWEKLPSGNPHGSGKKFWWKFW
jgi:hypothetical protein